MKKVITYGTYDLFHQGHTNLLRRAKELGDYLIVGVTASNYDANRGKLNVQETLMQRIDNVKRSGYADEIIIEEYEGQKIDDIIKYDVHAFAIGSDWIGKFDYLKEYCDVVYLERTKGVSSTKLRIGSYITRLGVIGSGRIASRFILESKYVSGLEVTSVYNPNISSAKKFASQNELESHTDNLEEFISKVDAVYIASPHSTHYDYSKYCINNAKHVLCEKPMTLSKRESLELFDLAKANNVILNEAIKTAYSPGFKHLRSIVKSGVIGQILDVEATFTMLKSGDIRELDKLKDGGSMNELSSYPLFAIFSILGTDYKSVQFITKKEDGVDVFTKGMFLYNNASASFKVGLKAKSEGDLVITGTKGYVYVPAPWWKTSYFELRYENTQDTQKYFYKFEGDGLRYEISSFFSQITNSSSSICPLSNVISMKISEVIEQFNNDDNCNHI